MMLHECGSKALPWPGGDLSQPPNVHDDKRNARLLLGEMESWINDLGNVFFWERFFNLINSPSLTSIPKMMVFKFGIFYYRVPFSGESYQTLRGCHVAPKY